MMKTRQISYLLIGALNLPTGLEDAKILSDLRYVEGCVEIS